MQAVQSNAQLQNKLTSDTSLTAFWRHRISKLKCLSLNVTAEISQDCLITKEKGGVMHDAFGRVLEQVSPQAFQALWLPTFNTARFPQFSSNPPPKAFALNPPRELKSQYKQGEEIDFSIALFGQSTQYSREVLRALYQIGENGLGNQRSKFVITACETQDMQINANQQGSDKQGLVSQGTLPSSDKLVAHFNSPAYFKQKGHRIFQAPEFEYLLSRIIYRTNWLSVLSDQNTLISQQERNALIEQAKQVRLLVDNTHKAKWSRYSVSRNKWMCFDGICGDAIYQHIPEQLMPLLRLAEHANIGGKTSFGMGEISFASLLEPRN